MAIAFSCSCGKHLRAREEYAGRKIKCPGCQTVLTIPAEASVPVTAKATPPPAPEPILDDEPPAVPLAKPVAMKVPEAVLPLARMAPSVREDRGVPATGAGYVPLSNPWVDRSLEQTATPWRGDDRERFNHGMESRSGSMLWLVLVALFVVIALTAAFFTLREP